MTPAARRVIMATRASRSVMPNSRESRACTISVTGVVASRATTRRSTSFRSRAHRLRV